MWAATIKIFLAIIFLASFACRCSSSKVQKNKATAETLKFLDEYTIPFNYRFQQTVVGGLSGIDHDKEKDLYYIISDDRSERNNARFYKAKISISDYKIDSVIFLETSFFKNRFGSYYPGPAVDPFHSPDPEAIRYNPLQNTCTWSSEGERLLRTGNTVLQDASITQASPNGDYIDTFPLSGQLHMSAAESGPRRNGVFEGLTFSNDFKTLYVSVEEPLYNDGPRAGINDSTGLIRIIAFDVASKKETGQYAYRIDGVSHTPATPGAYVINGVADILYIEKNKLLVLERSFSTGRPSCTIKVYLADLSSAKNIQHIPSLVADPVTNIVDKKLVLNMDDLQMYIDNIEGICFGPDLPNGKKSLMFISDNNFVPFQKTQILLFEMK